MTLFNSQIKFVVVNSHILLGSVIYYYSNYEIEECSFEKRFFFVLSELNIYFTHIEWKP